MPERELNRLAAVQEHRLIVRAVERGVPAERIAEALDLDVGTIQRRFRMLNGICAEAVELLKDTTCPLIVFELLRQMAPIRQVEAAELMIGQNNFSALGERSDRSMAGSEPSRIPVRIPNHRRDRKYRDWKSRGRVMIMGTRTR